ncbi:peptidylprolyl isomerase [Paludisphaera soli]|uniref:peptidylprolyl isomerase n=1 Tax=Paludisphaera soli TaxID=2712865 RepID=UPI0013EB6D82|nr:peptidylprolyl isomerase [Paludisphaera soli]
MKRQTLAVALIGVAIGGCAQSRNARMPETSGDGPVGMEAVPSIHDTINRGTHPSVARATLPDPANPNWSGHPLIAKRPETGLAPRVAASDGGPPSTTPAPTPPQARQGESPRQLAAAPAFEATPTSGDLPKPEEAVASDAPALPPALEADPDPNSDVAMQAPPLPDAEPAPAPYQAEVESEGDPLLGPKPELMPAIEVAPAPAEAPAKPKAAPSAEPEPEPSPAPAPAEEAPDLSPAPAKADAPSAGYVAPRGDGQVRQVATTSAAPAADVVGSANVKEAGLAAARIGDDVITMGELSTAVREAVRKQGGKAGQLSRQELNMVAKHVLAALIERTMLVQEAKHHLKDDDKQIKRLLDVADKVWREEELPVLRHQNLADDDVQLRRKLSEEGRSLSAMHQNFRQEFLAHVFMQQRLSGKVAVGLPEMLAYYNKHVNDKENHRTAAIVWREILVEKGRHATEAEARAKIDALRARLDKGEDFAALAAAESEGPSRVKADGGLMETAPGSYVVAAVNQAIETLPLGAVSGVIEGPTSFHVVRVESRRSAGPASFAELQDEIRKTLENEKSGQERQALIAQIRKKTFITTIFDGTESDPRKLAR